MTGLPLRAVKASAGLGKYVGHLDTTLVRIRPTLFGYQYVMRLTPHAKESIHFNHLRLVGTDDQVNRTIG